MLAAGDHEQAALVGDLLVDRPDAMPPPGLDAPRHRVIDHQRDVDVIDVQLGSALGLELFLGQIGRDEREVLARDPVALRGVAVAAVRERDPAHAAGDHHDVAADVLPEILLEDPAVLNLYAFDHVACPHPKTRILDPSARRGATHPQRTTENCWIVARVSAADQRRRRAGKVARRLGDAPVAQGNASGGGQPGRTVPCEGWDVTAPPHPRARTPLPSRRS